MSKPINFGKTISFLLALLLMVVLLPAPAHGQNTTYYVANLGLDDNDGLSPGTAFETITKVNSLDLQPGDKILFKCGDTWRAEMLTIDDSGADGNPIVFGSYPEACTDKPILSGALPVNGWTLHSGNIYRSAALSAVDFPYGINQLFRAEQRLMLGRWPNLDQYDAGYSTIDAQTSGTLLTDDQMPAVNWTGAVAHIKGMRWYILNRQVTGVSGTTLTLNSDAGCWGGNCTGWGFFLNNHYSTLDQEGEWYYNPTERRVYLVSSSAPADNEIEATVILKDDGRSWGGVTLGEDLNDAGISYVVVENLDIQRWFWHGIATPTNHAHYENHHVTLQNNSISDVDRIGINLSAWVWEAQDGRPDGWRGGYDMIVSGNVIDTANNMGINTRSRNSSFSDNIIRNVGLIENLGAAGMGCSFEQGEGQCTEDGNGIRIKVDEAADSGNYNTLTRNRLERIAHTGINIFGHHNTLEQNVILQPCYAKGDCGGVGAFGSNNLGDTPVHDLILRENIIVDTLGNTDGCNVTYKELFGFGFYIDNGSRDVAITGNTVISSTVHGILFQRSTGTVTDNTLYNNSRTWPYNGAQVYVGSSPAYVATHTGNVLYPLSSAARTLSINDQSRLGASDNNYFFHPYQAEHINADGALSLSAWQTASSKDGNSEASWFSLASGEAPRSRIFYNDTTSSKTFDLGDRKYLDLDQNAVSGNFTLAPFTSRILIDNGAASLSLLEINPSFGAASEAADFTLTVSGAGFTDQSVVRWNGSARSTNFVNSFTLTATILTADVSTVADNALTVYDVSYVDPDPNETALLTFRVLASLSRVHLPVIAK